MNLCTMDHMAITYTNLWQPWFTCTQDLHNSGEKSRMKKAAPERPPNELLAVDGCQEKESHSSSGVRPLEGSSRSRGWMNQQPPGVYGQQ